MRLDRLLSSLGYCSRSEVKDLIRQGRLQIVGKSKISVAEHVEHSAVLFDGAQLDPPAGLVLILNKPAGYICSHREKGLLIYDLLPERFRLRRPPLSAVGRLDKDSTGLLLMTDDGQLNHQLTAPKHKVAKCYRVTLESDLSGREAELFASGSFILSGDDAPLKPVEMTVFSAREVEMKLFEGRNRQIRRMFEEIGNSVVTLHRFSIGDLQLGPLGEGEFRVLAPFEIEQALGAA